MGSNDVDDLDTVERVYGSIYDVNGLRIDSLEENMVNRLDRNERIPVLDPWTLDRPQRLSSLLSSHEPHVDSHNTVARKGIHF